MQHWLQAILERDHGICFQCGLPVEIDGKGDYAPEIDHVIPVIHGGSNHPSNKVLTHSICNRLKGSELTHADLTREVPRFLCVVCHQPIPNELLGRPGKIRKTCSRECRQANKSWKRKKNVPQGTTSEAGVVAPIEGDSH